MKKSILVVYLCLIYSSLYAQKVIEKSLPYSGGQTVNLNFKFGDSISVSYWDKNELSVRMEVMINDGKLNDAFLVETSSTANELTVKTNLDQKVLSTGKEADCPGKKARWSGNENGEKYYVCSTIRYQVFLPRQAQLKVETINANINIKGATNAVSAKTISGFIDMTWPASKGANLFVKTISGEVYSDLDIDMKGKKEKHPIVGYLLQGSVKGGGPELHLESISNNLYLRKN